MFDNSIKLSQPCW